MDLDIILPTKVKFELLGDKDESIYETEVTLYIKYKEKPEIICQKIHEVIANVCVERIMKIPVDSWSTLRVPEANFSISRKELEDRIEYK